MKNIQLNKIITIEAGKRQSKPCVRGMRIAVEDVINWLKTGMSPDQIIRHFPELNKRDIQACSQFAQDEEQKNTYLKI